MTDSAARPPREGTPAPRPPRRPPKRNRVYVTGPGHNLFKHGLKWTKEYKCWENMKGRCFNSNIPGYKNYGGRGITVCARWKDSFKNFYADMGPMPSPKHTIERIDTNKDYGPENCRWATKLEQNRNMRTTRRFEIDGVSMTLGEWSELYNVPYSILQSRVYKNKMTIEEALTVPPRYKGKKLPVTHERYMELMAQAEALAERVDTFLECWGKSQETPVTLKRLKEALAAYRAFRKGEGGTRE